MLIPSAKVKFRVLLLYFAWSCWICSHFWCLIILRIMLHSSYWHLENFKSFSNCSSAPCTVTYQQQGEQRNFPSRNWQRKAQIRFTTDFNTFLINIVCTTILSKTSHIFSWTAYKYAEQWKCVYRWQWYYSSHSNVLLSISN